MPPLDKIAEQIKQMGSQLADLTKSITSYFKVIKANSNVTLEINYLEEESKKVIEAFKKLKITEKAKVKLIEDYSNLMFEAKQNERKKSLKALFDQGIIDQAEYDKQYRALLKQDQDYLKEKDANKKKADEEAQKQRKESLKWLKKSFEEERLEIEENAKKAESAVKSNPDLNDGEKAIMIARIQNQEASEIAAKRKELRAKEVAETVKFNKVKNMQIQEEIKSEREKLYILDLRNKAFKEDDQKSKEQLGYILQEKENNFKKISKQYESIKNSENENDLAKIIVLKEELSKAEKELQFTKKAINTEDTGDLESESTNKIKTLKSTKVEDSFYKMNSDELQKDIENTKALVLAMAQTADEFKKMAKSSEEEYNNLAEQKRIIDEQLANGGINNLSEQEREKLEIESESIGCRMELEKKLFDTSNENYLKSLELSKIYSVQKVDLEKESADLIIAERKRIYDATQKYNDEALKSVENGLSLISIAENEQYRKDRAAHDEKVAGDKKAIQDALAAKTISQEAANEKTKKIDEEMDKKKEEIAGRQAKRERILNLYKVTVQTASAIVSAMNTQPFFPMGLLMAATAATMGAVNYAKIATSQAPNLKAARGMYIQGNSHAMGGVNIEAEGGEMIINKRSSAAYAPLLSAINEAGGGVPFVQTGTDGGFAKREYRRYSSQGADYGRIAQAVKDGMSETNIFTAVEDVNKGQENYAKLYNKTTN